MLKKTTPKYQFADWLVKAKPSKKDYFIFHDPKMTIGSKRTTVSFMVRTKLHYKGYKAKVRSILMPDSFAKEKGLKFSPGYEPLICYLTMKQKKKSGDSLTTKQK